MVVLKKMDTNLKEPVDEEREIKAREAGSIIMKSLSQQQDTTNDVEKKIPSIFRKHNIIFQKKSTTAWKTIPLQLMSHPQLLDLFCHNG